MGLGLLFYILLGFRYSKEAPCRTGGRAFGKQGDSRRLSLPMMNFFLVVLQAMLSAQEAVLGI